MAALINCPACDASVSNEAQFCPRCGQPIAFQPTVPPRPTPPAKTKHSPVKIGCLVLLGLSFVFWLLGNIGNDSRRQIGTGNERQQNLAQSTPSVESPKAIALRLVELDFRWRKGAFGGAMIADFTISNPSAYAIKDIEITCEHSAASGTEIDSNTRTIYEMIPAKGKKVIKGFNMGFIHSQAEKSACTVVDLLVL